MTGIKIGLDAAKAVVYIEMLTEQGSATTVTVSAKIAYMLAAQLKASASVLEKYVEGEAE